MDENRDNYQTYFSKYMFPFPFSTSSSEKIRIDSFLESSERAVQLMEVFKVSGHIIQDMKLCMDIIKKKHTEDVTKYVYLHDIILDDKDSESGRERIESFLWLTRYLHFFSRILRHILADKHDTFDNIKKEAYNQTLEQHSGWLSTNLFEIQLKNKPTKDSILSSLIFEDYDALEQLMDDMRFFIPGLESCVQHIFGIYTEFFDGVYNISD